jgi:hypothetical protein
MIERCFNPECSENLRYLNQGSVYAWERGSTRMFHTEFFWLCPTCSRIFQLASDESGRPVLSPRSLRIGPKRQGYRVRRVLREM